MAKKKIETFNESGDGPGDGTPMLPAENKTILEVKAPNFRVAEFKIVNEPGVPLVVHKFSEKAKKQMMATQEEGAAAKGKKNREPRDFKRDFHGARHISTEGWDGIHAGAFRAGMISACKTCGVVMTKAKLAISILADGRDKDDGTPLVRIYGEPVMDIRPARNENGTTDLRSRPMYPEWYAILRVRYDADMMSLETVTNLLLRTGLQVGTGEGRPDSKKSAGCGWGTWVPEGKPKEREALIAIGNSIRNGNL
jgi:hypothetical protein